MTARSRFIVCEKTNHWAIALRWALADGGVRVYETRTWADCWRELETSPISLLAVELREDNVVDVLRGLLDLRWWFPQAGAIVMATRDFRPYEWQVREAGALHVVLSRRNLVPVIRLVTRFLERAARRPDRGLRECVWERLPWPVD